MTTSKHDHQLLDNDHIELARSLAHPTDKSIRDATVETLSDHLSNVETLSALSMLKLWKALYYCMWLSDKQPIQMELAEKLSRLLHVFKIPKLSFKYLEYFFKTMLREWTLLDQHRINKYYIFIRFMLREAFRYLLNSKWKVKYIKQVVQVIQDEVLLKIPNGIRFHLTDIYIEELYIVTNGNLSLKYFLQVIQPFLHLVKVSNDQVFHDRITNQVFIKYLTKYASENSNKIDSHSNTGNDDGKYFLNVKTTTLQAIIFDIASSEDISETNRRKVYTLHKEFAKTTGQDFITVQDDNSNEKETEVEKPVNGDENNSQRMVGTLVDNKVDNNKEKSKKKRKVDDISDSSNAETRIVEESETSKSKVKKAKLDSKSELKESNKSSSNIAITEVDASVTVLEVGINSDISNDDTKMKSNLQLESHTAKLPVEQQPMIKQPMIQQSMIKQSVEDTTASTNGKIDSGENIDFIASKQFAGRKVGFVFHLGDKGVGYYKDINKLNTNRKAATFKGHTKALSFNDQAGKATQNSSSKGHQNKKSIKWKL